MNQTLQQAQVPEWQFCWPQSEEAAQKPAVMEELVGEITYINWIFFTITRLHISILIDYECITVCCCFLCNLESILISYH